MNEKRVITTEAIYTSIIDLVYKANFHIPPVVVKKLNEILHSEQVEPARMVVRMLLENSEIARNEKIPLCQDCGVAVVFIEIGQDVILEGEFINDAVNRGIIDAYERFFLRKSVVSDPLRRTKSETNRPAIIHVDFIKGNVIRLLLLLKGGGSENMTALKLFRPTVSVDDIVAFIVDSVIEAGPNPCPPIFLGVGIGGTADVALVNSKRAILRQESAHQDSFYSELEDRILKRLNDTGIGPLGFGGQHTVAGVFIKEAPAHIATLAVALNLNCHSLRYGIAEI